MYTEEIIRSALAKLKHYCYQEKTNLYIREKIAVFLLNNTDTEIIDKILNLTEDDISQKIEQIGFSYLHKNVSEQVTKKEQKNQKTRGRSKEFDPYKTFSFSNIVNNNLELSSFNFFIDCPIELHLLCCCWAIKYGHLLESQMLGCAYGNRLNIKRDTGKLKFYSQDLYKKYYNQFQQWRDRCVTTAKKFLENGNSVSIINLDLRRFYYFVDIDFDEISDFLQGKDPFYIQQHTEIIKQIHEKFSNIVGMEDKHVLPIGLITSGLLSNWYLRNFDKFLSQKLRPLYYGRYVDDILIVLSNPPIPDSRNPKEDIFKILEDSKVINRKSKKSLDYYVRVEQPEGSKNYQEVPLKAEKVLVHFFDSKAPLVLIDKFYDELKRQSSEYRFLPDENDLNKSFMDEAYNIIYGSSSFVYREIRDIKPNKNGISSFFRKASVLALFSKTDDSSIKKTSREIFSFFSGKVILEYSQFWERAFTYFVISRQIHFIDKLYKKIYRSISDVEINIAEAKNDLNVGYDEVIIRENLKKYLNISLATALSLNTKILKSIESSIQLSESSKRDIINCTQTLRLKNFFRHNHCYWPLINIFDSLRASDVDFTSYTMDWISVLKPEEFQEIKFDSVYRYIYFHEIQFILICEAIFIKNDPITLKAKEFINKCKMLYKRIYPFLEATIDENISVDCSDKLGLIELNSPRENEFKVAVVSKKIEPSNLLKEFLSNDGDFLGEFKTLCNILNEAEKNKADICAFPECSIHFQFLPLFLRESTFKNRSFVFGIKHIAHKDRIYNFTASIVPFESFGFSSACLVIRPKNFPAPGEQNLFENEISRIPGSKNCYKFYKPSEIYYDLIQWRGLSFSTFNCFELADIESRSLLKSLIDMLIIVEFNKDIPYFSSLVESSSRDLHAYVVQVNNSLYGDSRITQPTSSSERNIVQIKGGDNSYIVVGTVNIEDLRLFQLKTYSKQIQHSNFKLVPPDFNVENVKARGLFKLMIERLKKAS